jgi:hypothetical protein
MTPVVIARNGSDEATSRRSKNLIFLEYSI